jgi:UDP-N-acetyl-D-glucosamine dehydrogenase
MREHRFDLRSVDLTPQGVAAYDLLLLATNHDAFDYTMIGENARLIVDTRGVYLDPAPNVVKA